LDEFLAFNSMMGFGGFPSQAPGFGSVVNMYNQGFSSNFYQYQQQTLFGQLMGVIPPPFNMLLPYGFMAAGLNPMSIRHLWLNKLINKYLLEL
jgi:hypothetical protein